MFRPSSVILYVRKYPLAHDLGDRNVSAAVPTTRCNSLSRALNGTIATENAASLPSRGKTATVVDYFTSKVVLKHIPENTPALDQLRVYTMPKYQQEL